MFWTRVASGVVAAPLFLLLVYLGFPYYHILVAAIAAVMAWEFTRMDGEGGIKRRAFIALASVAAVALTVTHGAPFALLMVLVATIVVVVADQVAQRPGFHLVQGAIPYVAVPAVSLVFLLAKGDWQTVFWFLAVVWLTDIGAYIVGRALKGPKLAPTISPNKTWSGAIGGLVIGTGAGLAWLMAIGVPPTPTIIGVSLLVAVLTEIGDLF
ncbi:MAG: phosphatidate cytidylyltransferase, partial [Rhodospirillaceae bacterium]|nr:phosphatidate cytidylyltransferase [Rhodospirillaceae bacterium]